MKLETHLTQFYKQILKCKQTQKIQLQSQIDYITRLKVKQKINKIDMPFKICPIIKRYRFVFQDQRQCDKPCYWLQSKNTFVILIIK